jgi:hypothetical protein
VEDLLLPLLNDELELWREAGTQLRQVNTHVSALIWTNPPAFGDEGPYLEVICEHLRDRRQNRADPNEPTGLLTHHLYQDDASYSFVASLLAMVADHPAATWVDPRALF